jgi:hypothetical protein
VNISEAAATMRVLDFLAGDIDHCDATTRAALAADLVILEGRARKALMVGTARPAEEWDADLCLVTFEAP